MQCIEVCQSVTHSQRNPVPHALGQAHTCCLLAQCMPSFLLSLHASHCTKGPCTQVWTRDHSTEGCIEFDAAPQAPTGAADIYAQCTTDMPPNPPHTQCRPPGPEPLQALGHMYPTADNKRCHCSHCDSHAHPASTPCIQETTQRSALHRFTLAVTVGVALALHDQQQCCVSA